MPNYDCFAACVFGLEAVVARELTHLELLPTRTEDGRVWFTADPSGLARANLALRTAERVFVVAGCFEADEFDTLYEQTVRIPWEEWLPRDAAIPVQADLTRSPIRSVRSTQSVVKRAIVSRLQQAYGLLRLPESGPRFGVHVLARKRHIVLALDCSGTGLHKRGYRTRSGVAPLRETLAAGLVQLSVWTPDRPFADPLCGSGTIAIEAALIGRGIAPGLNRRFDAEHWPWFSADAWSEARAALRSAVRPRLQRPLIATDHDARILKIARHNAQRAGVADDIHFQQCDVADFRSSRSYGCLITNPPYGERLSERRAVDALYRKLAETVERLPTWSVFVLTPHPQLERLFGKTATRRRKLYNSRIPCTFYQFLGPKPPEPGRHR
ncbi:MAG: class I SAM-dependent RNA methyltransferase [Planctomycetota bacterium]|nr:MAG: class I SAM-dependent RNA methyltransferase [Planctomycetota bacterium]